MNNKEGRKKEESFMASCDRPVFLQLILGVICGTWPPSCFLLSQLLFQSGTLSELANLPDKIWKGKLCSVVLVALGYSIQVS
jgi:hypothetical protein